MVLERITNDAYYDMARKLGFDTANGLTQYIVGNPNWVEENGAYLSQILTPEEFQALWQQDKALDEYLPQTMVGIPGVTGPMGSIGTWREAVSLLMGTGGGGSADIAEKIMTGNASDINKWDLIGLALEMSPLLLAGVSKLLKSVGVSDDALKGLKAGYKGDKFAKEINNMDDVIKVVDQARKYAKNMGISFDDALRTIASEDALRKMADISNTAGKQQYASSFLRVADDIASIGGIPKDVTRLIREGVDSVYEARRIYETAEEIAYQTKRNIRNVLWEITGGNDKLLEDMAFILQQEEAGTGAYHYFGLVCEETMYAGRAGKFGTAGTASTASTGGTPFASGFMSGGDDAAKAAGAASFDDFAKAAGATDDAFRAGASEVFGTIDSSSLGSIEKGLKSAGYSDDFIKRVISETTAQAKNKPLEHAFSDAFKYISGQTPKAGITPDVLKQFSFNHPTLKKLGMLLLGGTGIGTGYLGLKAAEEAAFAGFMFEEAEQMTMFAQFFTSDDPQALARTIYNVSLPIWDLGESWAQNVGQPVTGIVSGILGEGVGGSILSGPALGTHESFTRAVIDKITNLQEMGAWTGLQYDPDTLQVTNWGRPTSQEEIGAFLEKNPQYYANYEKELQNLAREDPGTLYELYYEGLTTWYDLPQWMRDQIDAYKTQLQQWQYDAQSGRLTGNDALKMADALADAVWYGQEDQTILNDAIAAGNLIYSMIQTGEISEAKGNAMLTTLQTKLKNNENAGKLYTVDSKGNIVWTAMSPEQIQQSFGSLTTIATKPELVFQPPNSTVSQRATPITSGLKDMDPRTQTDRYDLGLSTGGRPVFGLEAKELERAFNEFAESAKGTEGMRGVGFTGQATAEEQAAMAAVPGSGFTWTPRENLTRAEEQALSQVENGIRSWDDIKNIAPETYNSLMQKGYGPGAKAPATQTPTQGTKGVSETDVENFFNALTEMQQTAGQYGVFETPTKVKGEPLYTPEMLEAMIQFGTPQERATAMQQQDIYNKQKYQGRDRGTYGYELASLSNDQRKMLEELATVLETGEIPEKSKLVRHEATQPGWGTTYGYGSIKK